MNIEKIKRKPVYKIAQQHLMELDQCSQDQINELTDDWGYAKLNVLAAYAEQEKLPNLRNMLANSRPDFLKPVDFTSRQELDSWWDEEILKFPGFYVDYKNTTLEKVTLHRTVYPGERKIARTEVIVIEQGNGVMYFQPSVEYQIEVPTKDSEEVHEFFETY